MEEIPTIVQNDKKTIRAWALFDWANSAYSLVISTAIFPIYYISMSPDTLHVFGSKVSNSALYSFSISFSYVFIALIAPILAGVADHSNKRLFFLKTFTTIGAIACACLYFFNDTDAVWLGTAAFVIATVGFAGSLIFYDAFLPIIATEDQYDRVSAKGYAYGYVGSVLLLLFILLMSQKPTWFGFAADSSLPYRIGFVLVGVWWFGFAQYSFWRLPKDAKSKMPKGMIKKGYEELKSVFRKVKKQKNLQWYLASFFFNSAGVQTIIYLATVFAKEELNFASGELILTVLILQIVAIGGAFLFARIAERIGSKRALFILIGTWMLICISAYFIHAKTPFFILAFFVGMVLGGIQSSARAAYTKLLDGQQDLNSYYSFYDVLFYLSVVFGTFLFGIVDNITGNLRYSVLVLTFLFVIAFILLTKVTIGDQRSDS